MMSITLEKKEKHILLRYYSDDNGVSWLKEKLEKDERCSLKRVYHLSKNDIYISDEDNLTEDMEIAFVIANLERDYFKFEKERLGININVFIHKDLKIKNEMFMASRKISIFQKIDKLISEDVYIEKNIQQPLSSGHISFEEFTRLIKNFPGNYELTKYTHARIERILGDYFDSCVDADKKYNNYMNRKKEIYKNQQSRFDYSDEMVKKNEKDKYTYILKRLEKMLREKEGYTEKQWQKRLLKILLLIYPKYIKVFPEVRIKNKRSIDYVLIDSKGNLDIIEIKKPDSQKKIMSKNKYRNNYIPSRELIGSVMQIEKYIFILNKWGEEGEKKLTEKFKNKMPNGLKIKIINPQALIIIGCENDLSEEEKNDLEFVRRKYKNIIDIVTYDELIRSLKRLIEKFSKSHLDKNKQ